MISIVDTDALIGLTSPTDPLHERSKNVAVFLRQREAHLIVSPTTLAEFSLVGLKRLGLKRMKSALASFMEGIVIVETIGSDHVRAARELLETQQSIDHSFCDCCIMVLAKQLNADCIFSFDHGYTKNGFTIAEDFIKKRTVA